jgi:hypothetical protein
VLQGSEYQLRVRKVRHCGWTDLGTPERLAQCLRQARRGQDSDARVAVDLRQALDRHGEQQQARLVTSGCPRAAVLR